MTGSIGKIGTFWAHIWRAVRRARVGILTVAVAYLASAVVGMIIVSTGSDFALQHRDRIVSRTQQTSPILESLRKHRPAIAAAMDFAANLAGGTASTLAGYWAPGVYLIAIYRGWVGGIVSVDRQHQSRLALQTEARYYLLTLLLQLLPYILAGGIGVNIGLARIRPVEDYAGPKILGIPKEALLDAVRIYALIVPLFAIASVFEFFAIPN